MREVALVGAAGPFGRSAVLTAAVGLTFSSDHDHRRIAIAGRHRRMIIGRL